MSRVLISTGFLVDDQLNVTRGTTDRFTFEIEPYGGSSKAVDPATCAELNLLIDMVLQIYNQLNRSGALPVAQESYSGCHRGISYHLGPRASGIDPKTGPSRFTPNGLGIPSETEVDIHLSTYPNLSRGTNSRHPSPQFPPVE